MRRFGTIWVMALVIFGSCKKEIAFDPESSTSSQLRVPAYFPDPEFPADNTFSDARWELGKRLFHDPVMSRDFSLSCASCHQQSTGFAVQEATSFGVDNAPGLRNASTLVNVAYNPYFTREGGVPTLEMQVAVPVQEHNEFDFNLVEIVERIVGDPEYIELSQKAYDRMPDTFVITRALATYERSLISGNSRYDQYAQGNSSALTSEEIAGMDLFFSDELNCTSCHGGFNFTNYEIVNNGLYAEYADSGLYRLTEAIEDIGKFKIPTLRNVEVTGPYMHDGSLITLEEVVDHYNQGGQGHFNQSELIQALNLTNEERSQLVAFLKSLTDEEFLTDARFSP